LEISKVLVLAGLPIFAYLIGSIPWGLVLTKMFTAVDIRQEGSRNIGASNVRRVAGNRLGILALAGDVLKGAIPAYLATQAVGSEVPWAESYISAVALSAFFGHLYPVYLGFRSGGKGVATAAGCFAVLTPVASLLCMLVFILVIIFSNRISAGSLFASAVLPLAVWAFTRSGTMAGAAVVVSVFIAFRHRDNIRRLISGVEPVLWERKKD
jgi:glycerol-3-phosphate acyltransferase PlsY